MERYIIYGLVGVVILQSLAIMYFHYDSKAEISRSALYEEENNDLLKTITCYEKSESRQLARIQQLEMTVMGHYTSGVNTPKEVEQEIKNDYGTDVPPLIAVSKNKLVH